MRLTIRPKVRSLSDPPPGQLLLARQLEVLLDGRPVSGLQAVQLTIEQDGVPRATVSFYPDHLEVDAEVLGMLEAVLKQQEADRVPAGVG